MPVVINDVFLLMMIGIFKSDVLDDFISCCSVQRFEEWLNL